MTQKEFESRAIEVSAKEFEAINEVYMNSEVDKDEFCKIWCKMNQKRVKAYKEAKKNAEIEAENKHKVADLYWTLFYNTKIDERFSMMGSEVLSKASKKFLESLGIKTENIIASNMMYNMSIYAGINK